MDNQKIKNLLSINLFEKLGIEHLSPEEKITFIEKMGEVIQGRILLRVLKEIPEEKKEKLEVALSDASNFDSFLLAITQVLPNYEEVIKEEIAMYKEEVINRYKQE